MGYNIFVNILMNLMERRISSDNALVLDTECPFIPVRVFEAWQHCMTAMGVDLT